MNKNLKTILWCCGGLAVVVGAVAFTTFSTPSTTTPAASTEEPQFSQSKLDVMENKHDFGDIVLTDGDVSHQFAVINSGPEPVTIQKVYTSCMCTTANITDASGEQFGMFGMQGHRGLALNTDIVVNPGEQALVEAIFDPAAHGPNGTGMAQRSIILETNSALNPKTEIRFSANVIK